MARFPTSHKCILLGQSTADCGNAMPVSCLPGRAVPKDVSAHQSVSKSVQVPIGTVSTFCDLNHAFRDAFSVPESQKRARNRKKKRKKKTCSSLLEKTPHSIVPLNVEK